MSTLSQIPDLPPFQVEWGDFQVWWQIAKGEIQGQLDSLSTAQAALAQALDAEHHADWSGVNDDNGAKPDDNATLGADWSANLTSRPTELTDGRVAAGLTSAGDLNRNITTTRANSSNLLRTTGGGNYTGDLNATFGANLATNVTNVIPANLPATTAASNAFGFTGAISYTSTTTSATISVGAGTLYAGQAISYNAMSVGVSGSGTQTFYLYVTANWNVGGAHTLHASTSSLDTINAANIAYVGQVSVTFTTSGSGSGTGGGGGEIGGGCVTEDTIIPDHGTAGNVPVAGEMLIANPITFKERRGTVTKNDRKFAQCVRIVSESGVRLKCSRDARIGNHHGGLVYAPELLGVVCPVRINGEWRNERVVKVENIGEQPIRHITCENDLFLAGEEPDGFFLHHNLKNA
jgi:hypothetical protein